MGRTRLTVAETERRMLAAGAELAREEGMAVGLRLGMETVIARAGVARAAVYRRWPNRDDYVVDVLRQLARDTSETTIGAGDLDPLLDMLVERFPTIAPDDRMEVAGRVLLEAATLEFDVLVDSDDWRAVLRLSAAADALPASDLRTAVLADLAAADDRRAASIARTYRATAEVLGLRPGTGELPAEITYEELARLGMVLTRGLVTQALRSAAARERAGRLVGTGLLALLHAHLTPDPDVEVVGDWAARLRIRLAEVLPG